MTNSTCSASALLALVMTLGPLNAFAEPAFGRWISDLENPDKASAAVASLVKEGEASIGPLLSQAQEGESKVRRGWAIVALARIGGPRVDSALKAIHENTKESQLVRTWAAAGRIEMAKSFESLIKLQPLARSFPALNRPLGKRIVASITSAGTPSVDALENLLQFSINNRNMQSALNGPIMSVGVHPLGQVMFTSKNTQVRRQAAAYLATIGRKDPKNVAGGILKLYRFDPEAKEVSWAGGALYIPQIQWPREEARTLIGHLLAWMIYCDHNGLTGEYQQIINNLRSVGLLGMAGIRMPGWSDNQLVSWLKSYKDSIGASAVRDLLKAQGLAGEKRFSSVVR